MNGSTIFFCFEAVENLTKRSVSKIRVPDGVFGAGVEGGGVVVGAIGVGIKVI